MRIAPARVEDLAEVTALERSVPEASHWAEGEYRAMVEGPGESPVRRQLLVAYREESLVGFAVGSFLAAVRTGELESIAVAVEHRRRGVGRALCAALLEWFRKQEVEEVGLEVRASSEGPIALYRGLGFVEVGRRKDYYRSPVEDAIRMRLTPGSGCTEEGV